MFRLSLGFFPSPKQSFLCLVWVYLQSGGQYSVILDQVTPSENRSPTYDALQRLKTGGTVSITEAYDYDLVGNCTTSFISTIPNHDDLNRILEDDQFTCTYENHSNLITKTNKATSIK
ncbi:MAG: hypothetical protein H0X47_19325 [Nitrospirales bacterium]|nr:hypothetical protein [Nitrospirales bacterium]